MTQFIAFNGDADGLCALQQLRLAEHSNPTLITGVKRDIQLLDRVKAGSGDEVTTLDVSLDSNRAGLLRLLANGASVRYFDHHHAGEIPQDPKLKTYIDPAADVCTSILVDRYLQGKFRYWAIVAAFGDNLSVVGTAMGQAAGLDAGQLTLLGELGVCLNYNAYGDSIADLHFDPALLAEQLLPYVDPLEFARLSPAYAHLASGFAEDMRKARRLPPLRQTPSTLAVLLPDEAWARRAIGVFANELVQSTGGNKALAILSPNALGGYTVSVRVPANRETGADTFCRRFNTGGGRKTAGGINLLPKSDVDTFCDSFEACYA
ncbi:MAG: acetyltransferase [Sterolibacterium sp.]|nr:acetyltransferase [Sterolibacterium sp.]